MLSKQNSRRATEDGTAFRYKVSCTPQSKGVYRLNITVQSEEHNGSKLLINGLIMIDCNEAPAKDRGKAEDCPTVTKHEVQWCIREAINSGWDYRTQGTDFTLQVINEIFGLGFWSSDQAENPIRES